MAFYEQGRKGRDFEAGVRIALQAILASPTSSSASRSRRRRRGPARRIASATSTSLAAVVLHLGHACPDAELLKLATQQQLSAPGGARQAGEADARRPARRGAGDALRRAVAAAAGRRQAPPRCAALPALDQRSRDACGARPSCSSTASSGRTAASSTCSRPTTLSSTSGSRRPTGSRASSGDDFRRVKLPEERRGAESSARAAC